MSLRRHSTIIPTVALILGAIAMAVSQAGLRAAEASASPPVVDLSSDKSRHVFVAEGTPERFQGQPTTVLMPDGRTIFCAWTIGHGGRCGPFAKSEDAGMSWSAPIDVPESWSTTSGCPTIYRLVDPRGKSRLVLFVSRGADGAMHQAHSNDDGNSWSEMTSNGLTTVMPFCTIVPIDGGKRLLAATNIRRPNERSENRSNVIAHSISTDGGLTWSRWRIVHDLGELRPCEPCIVRSPDGARLLCLMRENTKHISLCSTSDDEGRTWSHPKPLAKPLHGDRHVARYADDGRLVVCFRDTGLDSPTKDHFVAWVGTFDDILLGQLGQYRIKLLHSYDGDDCGYSGLELLPSDTLVATAYVKYRPGPAKQSVVSVRFNLSETDQMAQVAAARRGNCAVELRN